MIPIDDEDALLEKLRQKLGPVKKQDERAELERLFGKRGETDEDRLRAKLVKPSISMGDVLDISIEKLAFGGEVIGRHNTTPVFVQDLVPGDTASVRITEVRQDMCRGEVIELRARSSNRVPPRCPLFGECGGCQLQSLVYTAQLHAKQVMAADVLKRIGGLDIPVRSVMGSPESYGYRLRTRMHVDTADRRRIVGYHARRSNRVVAVSECPLLAPVLNRIVT
ncbi:MAG TPA: TRAM domain-containing protein, partial [bacterium]|nr:TRAM domain-containing protein [bacterium]